MTDSIFPDFSLSRVFWGVVWLGCLFGLAISWLGLLGDRHWALDLLSHFRWQYLVAAGVVMLMAAGRRAWWMVLACLATVVLNVWLIFGFVEKAGEPVEGGEGLKVMCLNLLVGNEEVEAVLREVRRIDADVVMFVEVSTEWGGMLDPLKTDYRHHWVRPNGVYGLAVFSRVPLEDVKAIPLGFMGFPILETTLLVDSRPLTVIGAHPLPPMASRAFRGWVDHLSALGGHVTNLETPCLVMGDLNATPWCHGIRELQRTSELGFRLADSAAAWYAAYPTWSVGAPFGIHIDHILCTPELVMDQYEVGRDVSSDHRAVVARIRWVK